MSEPRPPAVVSEAHEQVLIEAPRDEAAIDLTDRIRPFLRRALRPDGLLAVTLETQLCSLALVDDAPGALEDLLAALEKMAPKGEYYQVNLRAPTERTGAAKVRASLLPRHLLLPFRARRLLLPEGITPRLLRHDFKQTETVSLTLMIY